MLAFCSPLAVVVQSPEAHVPCPSSVVEVPIETVRVTFVQVVGKFRQEWGRARPIRKVSLDHALRQPQRCDLGQFGRRGVFVDAKPHP